MKIHNYNNYNNKTNYYNNKITNYNNNNNKKLIVFNFKILSMKIMIVVIFHNLLRLI